jgi:hypothetical protein
MPISHAFGLGEAVVDVGLGAGEIEGMASEALASLEDEPDLSDGRAAVARHGEIHSVVGEHGVDLVGQGLDQHVEEVVEREQDMPAKRNDNGFLFKRKHGGPGCRTGFSMRCGDTRPPLGDGLRVHPVASGKAS